MCPSGFDFATYSVPIVPPAPGRLSTKNCWPSASLNPCARIRPGVSVAPPGKTGSRCAPGAPDSLAPPPRRRRATRQRRRSPASAPTAPAGCDRCVDLPAALQARGDETRRLHLLDELAQVARAASRPCGVPIACSITMNRPSITRTFGCVFANSTSGCFTPAAASSFSRTKSSSEAGEVGARTSCARF